MGKINIAQLLKNCPSGMELDCLMYEDVYFDYVDELNIIHCYIKHETHKASITFNQHGTPNSDIKSKCVIYPKSTNTWEGFQKPFKDGDILAIDDTVYIYNGVEELSPYKSHYVYVIADKNGLFSINTSTKKYGTRFATEEEKKVLFKAIKDNGYRWNEETKTLEKLTEPIFKINDNIQSKDIKSPVRIVDIKDGNYIFENGDTLDINLQNRWEFVSNKFDINRLIPFESKVLVRDYPNEKWKPAIWGFYDNDDKDYSSYIVESGIDYNYCIPYKGNEHLIGTINECEKYYKTWEDEN